MLETVDLTQKIGKEAYKQIMPTLREQMYATQKASWDAGVPIAIIFEGWDAAGKGSSIQTLTESLDPRGFKLYPIRAARTYEKKRPWLWRFWNKLPARGEWAIYDRSWYGRVLVERVEDLIPESEWLRGYRDILDFERTIADDGTLIIKFFLHISKAEQKRRFQKLEKDPLEAWHVSPEDWEHHKRYDDWLLAYEEMFERTESEWGPWTIVEATDRRFTQVKIYKTIIAAVQDRLSDLAAKGEAAKVAVPAPEATPVLPATPVEAEKPASPLPAAEPAVEAEAEAKPATEAEPAEEEEDEAGTKKTSKPKKDKQKKSKGKG